MIERILDDAKRILAETGMDIGGPALKQRLLDHGLKTDGTGKRVLFPRDVVDQAIADAPGSFTSEKPTPVFCVKPYTTDRRQPLLSSSFS